MLRARGSLPRNRHPNHHERTSPVHRQSLMETLQSTNTASADSSNEGNPFSDTWSFLSYGQITGNSPVITGPTNNEVWHEAHRIPALTNEMVSAINYSTTGRSHSDLSSPESSQHGAAAWQLMGSEGVVFPPYVNNYVHASLNGMDNPDSERSWGKKPGKPYRLILCADRYGQVNPTTYLTPLETRSNRRLHNPTSCPSTKLHSSFRTVLRRTWPFSRTRAG